MYFLQGLYLRSQRHQVILDEERWPGPDKTHGRDIVHIIVQVLRTKRIVDIIKIIKKSGVKIVSLSDFRKLLNIEKDNTSYKIAERLVAERFLLRLKKGVYLSTFNPPDSLEIANAVYTPSYISLESALNYHGILLQFPYSVTSVSPKKSKKMLIDEKALDYSPINKRDFHKMCQRIDHLPFLNKLKEIGI